MFYSKKKRKEKEINKYIFLTWQEQYSHDDKDYHANTDAQPQNITCRRKN